MITKLDWTIKYQVYVDVYYICTVVEAKDQKFAIIEVTSSSTNRPAFITSTLKDWLHLAQIKGK